VVYADGSDARMIQRLVTILGSEERAQNALILTGFLSKLEKTSGTAAQARAKRVREKFEEIVGVSYAEFLKLAESI
jgi:hypothetical protein